VESITGSSSISRQTWPKRSALPEYMCVLSVTAVGKTNDTHFLVAAQQLKFAKSLLNIIEPYVEWSKPKGLLNPYLASCHSVSSRLLIW